MRHLIWFISFFPLQYFAQTNNDVCIKTRWIAVQNDSSNNDLFDSDSKRIDSLDVFLELKSLVESGKIKIYNGSAGLNSEVNGQEIDYLGVVECWNENQDSLFKYDPFFEFSIQSDYPMVDEYGDPLIHTEPDGTQYYVYPPPEKKRVLLGDLYELRIREDKENDQFTPSTVAFCVKKGNRIKVIFWVNLKDALEVTKNEQLGNWLNFILDKNYQGFQYKQAKCDDKFNR